MSFQALGAKSLRVTKQVQTTCHSEAYSVAYFKCKQFAIQNKSYQTSPPSPPFFFCIQHNCAAYNFTRCHPALRPIHLFIGVLQKFRKCPVCFLLFYVQKCILLPPPRFSSGRRNSTGSLQKVSECWSMQFPHYG